LIVLRRAARRVLLRIAGAETLPPRRRRLSHLLADSGRVLSANVVGGALALLQSVVVTGALGIEQYAVFVLVVGSVTVINQLTSFRMNEFVVRYVSAALATGETREAAAALKFALVGEGLASVVAFVLIRAAAPLIAGMLLEDTTLAPLVAVYGLTILTNLIAETTLGTLQAFEQFRTQAVLTVTARALPLMTIVVAVLQGGDLLAIVQAAVIGNALSALLSASLMLREARRRLFPGWWRVSPQHVCGGWRSAASFALSTNAGATLSVLTKDADVVWLGLLRPAAEAAYYRIGFQVAAAALMPLAPLAQTLYPEMSRAAAERQWTYVRNLLRRSTRLTLLYVVPTVVALAAASPWLIEALFGEEFRPAVGVLVALLPGLAMSNVFVWSRPALLSLHQAPFTVRVNLIAAAVKLIGIATILPRWGHVGNALLTSFVLGSGIIACVLKVRAIIIEHQREPITAS
jgi:O-antigen/teichoic acid export membrane protein